MIWTLIRKEFQLELRKRSVISSLGLYLLSLVFICYITFRLRNSEITPPTWVALFWLTLLFSVINTVAKAFIGERRGREIYYYQIANPQSIILSKIIYNTALCTLLGIAAFLLFSVFLYNPIQQPGYFLLTLFLSALGFSSSLSLISGISSRTTNSNVLMAVLSFPVTISILLMAIKLTRGFVDNLDPSTHQDELLNLIAINCISGGLAYLLFPYIWRS